MYVDGLTRLLDGVWSQSAADTLSAVASSKELSTMTYNLDR